MLAHISNHVRSFANHKRAGVAVIFALAALPILTAVGCAIDYSRASQLRSKLQAAIDCASVGSVAKTSPAYIAAGTMSSSGSIPAGVTDARNIFNANMTGVTGYTLNDVTAVVTLASGAVTSTVEFSANVPTLFLGLIGVNTMTVTGSSVATANMPLYVDFYLLLDNSPSMSVGATPTDVATMVSATSASSFGSDQNCAFACHDTAAGATDNFYALAKSLGVTMRIDVLRTATQQLMTTAAQTEIYSNQFRMAIYDFGSSADTAAITTIFPLSSSLTSAQTAAAYIDVMTVNGQGDQNDQDTDFDNLLTQMNNLISSPGTGTSAAPEKYLFFVSDGVADENNANCLYTMTNSSIGNIAPRCQEPINTALCTTIKNRGIKIAVLYTTYLELPTNAWYNAWIAPFNVGPWGPSPNSQIALNMQSCASPGLYFEVSPTEGISAAMSALFQKAVADAHISN